MIVFNPDYYFRPDEKRFFVINKGHLNRCWAEILKAYGDENWDYPDPRCIKAPKMKNNLKFE